MIALNESTVAAVEGLPDAAALPPAGTRYIKLAEPIAIESRKRPVTRIKVTVAVAPDDGPWRRMGLRRGLYLSVRGVVRSSTPTGELLLCDHTGRDIATFSPVPLRDAETGVPRAAEWREILRTAQDILRERDQFDTVPLEFLGWLPIQGVPPERLVAVDPLAPKPRLLHTPENVVHHRRFGPGLHVAPFRGEKGELLIVAIGQDGGLDAMWPVTAVGTWALWVEQQKLPNTLLGGELTYDREPDQRELVKVDDRWTASDTLLQCRYDDVRYPRRDVVHVCPWRGRVNRQAYMLCVTNVFLSALSFQECADLRDGVADCLGFLEDVRRDAEHPDGVPYPITYHPDLQLSRKAASTAAGGGQ